MRAHDTDLGSWSEDLKTRNGVLVLRGYGIDVRVHRGHLRVEDGIGTDRRRGLLHRATSGLKRLVIIGHTGTITLDAVRWLAGVGASLVHIDGDGEVLAATHPAAYEQPRLRRAQALALDTPAGMALAHWLVREKLTAQAGMLDALEPHVGDVSAARAEVARSLDGLEATDDTRHAMYVEGMGAGAYWSAWSRLPVRFAERDRARVPAHWHAFGDRKSALSGQPKLATNPANAILNYLYAVMEAEATIAARIVGLDPGIGVFHRDARFRESLAADIMEPVRPEADRYLLELLTKRTFGARDFFETPRGACRVTPPLAAELASSCRLWGRVVGRVAEDLVHRLVDAPRYQPLPRLITRPRGRPAARLGRPPVAPATVAIDGRRSATVVERRCSGCGGPVPPRRRTCGPGCEALVRKAAGMAGVAAMRRRLDGMAADGVRPDRSPEARARASESMRRRRAEQRAWEAEHPGPSDPEAYWREVYPLVRGMSVNRIAALTGLTKGEASRIRNGRRPPHRRWWEALRIGAVPTALAVGSEQAFP